MVPLSDLITEVVLDPIKTVLVVYFPQEKEGDSVCPSLVSEETYCKAARRQKTSECVLIVMWWR